MSFRHTLAVLVTAASIVAAPTMAAAAPAKPAFKTSSYSAPAYKGPSVVQTVKMSGGDSATGEGLGGYVVPVVIVLAIGLGLYFALDDQGDTASPR